MQHKGEIIEKAVRESGYSLSQLANKMGKSRRWLYQVFERPNVSIDYILEIGKIIHHDFSQDIRELKQYKQSVEVTKWEDPVGEYMLEDQKAEYWKDKYLKLLEKYNETLKKRQPKNN